MNKITFVIAFGAMLIVPVAFADPTSRDIRDGVPADAYMAVFSQRNPERDAQREFEKQVWQAVQHEKLPQRIVALVMNLLPQKQRESATSISDELQTIFETIDWAAIAESPEVAYGQVMDVPQTHHLVILKLASTSEAANLELALTKMGEMVEKRSDGAVSVTVEERDESPVYTLSAREIPDFPFSPSFARMDDVLILSTSAEVAQHSVDCLLNGGKSKFDDARLQSQLDKLPKAEDSIVFYDGRQQFDQLRSIGDFIRQQAKDDPKAVRFSKLFERVMDELAILDYEVAVEYTDGQKNFAIAHGQLVANANEKLLCRVLASGEAFEKWQQWIPADAQAYSLTTGANLHPLYEWAVSFVRKEIPEAVPALEKFEQAQQQVGFNLDRDILQAFSGECVSVTLSASAGGQEQVVAMKCQKPDRVQELLRQWVEKLSNSIYAQGQELKLTPLADLEGFDELSANVLGMFNTRPVIGFRDGWMIVASSKSAAQRVLQTRSGDAPSIDTAAHFKRFGLEIEGPVYAVSYTDLKQRAKQAARIIRQLGAVAPMVVAISGAQTKPETMKSLQEAIGLLPSIANVVEKSDYFEGKLTVVQKGEVDGSYIKRCVTLVRSPTKNEVEKNVTAASREKL